MLIYQLGQWIAQISLLGILFVSFAVSCVGAGTLFPPLIGYSIAALTTAAFFVVAFGRLNGLYAWSLAILAFFSDTLSNSLALHRALYGKDYDQALFLKRWDYREKGILFFEEPVKAQQEAISKALQSADGSLKKEKAALFDEEGGFGVTKKRGDGPKARTLRKKMGESEREYRRLQILFARSRETSASLTRCKTAKTEALSACLLAVVEEAHTRSNHRFSLFPTSTEKENWLTKVTIWRESLSAIPDNHLRVWQATPNARGLHDLLPPLLSLLLFSIPGLLLARTYHHRRASRAIAQIEQVLVAHLHDLPGVLAALTFLRLAFQDRVDGRLNIPEGIQFSGLLNELLAVLKGVGGIEQATFEIGFSENEVEFLVEALFTLKNSLIKHRNC